MNASRAIAGHPRWWCIGDIVKHVRGDAYGTIEGFGSINGDCRYLRVFWSQGTRTTLIPDKFVVLGYRD